MEAVVSAIIGDLAGRSISFLINTYLNLTAATASDDDERLQRLLRRVHVIVEEAERRRVTNHAMLRQLNVLREEMYRGYHALDAMAKRQARKANNDVDESAVSGHPFAMSSSQFNPSKRARLVIQSRRGGHLHEDQKRLVQQVLGRLETIIADIKDEFIVFLTACPPLGRQPYSMHLIIGNCMFGRQMEMEHVVAFLLHKEGGDDDDASRKLGILSIIGPRRAGKSTLVEHACNDERVRDHFSQIVSFTLGDLKDDDSIVSLRSGRVIKHRPSDEGSVLVIVELDGDRNSKGMDDGPIMEDLFRKLCSVCRSRVPCVSKIIVTSRFNKIASLGTTEPLKLDYVAKEAYWYFFKVRAFGSTNTSEHPQLLSIAMDMAVEMDTCFGVVDIFAGRLTSNFNARFWRSTLAVLREFKKKNFLVNDARRSGDQNPEPFTPKITEEFVYHDDYELVGSVDGEVPKVSLQDVLFEGTRPQGKFDVLAWKSHIPPYYSYAYSCEILKPQSVATG